MGPSTPEPVVPRGLRWPGLAVAAVLLQALPGLRVGPFRSLRGALLVASGVLVAAWFAVNAHTTRGARRVGVAVGLFGALLNLAVMVPNGGMPVSASALAAIGHGSSDVTSGHLYKHRLADRSTVLRGLGDVIPVAPLHLVASVGDAILVAGLGGALLFVP
jgi:uncharacterized protein DUF5317